MCDSTFILVSFPLTDLLDSRLLPNFHFRGVNLWKKYWYRINIVVSRFNTSGRQSSAFRVYCIFLPDTQRWSMSPFQHTVSIGILLFGLCLNNLRSSVALPHKLPIKVPLASVFTVSVFFSHIVFRIVSTSVMLLAVRLDSF